MTHHDEHSERRSGPLGRFLRGLLFAALLAVFVGAMAWLAAGGISGNNGVEAIPIRPGGALVRHSISGDPLFSGVTVQKAVEEQVRVIRKVVRERTGLNYPEESTWAEVDAAISALPPEERGGLEIVVRRFHRADLENATLAECDLAGVFLQGVRLGNARLAKADLRGAFAPHVTLSQAALNEADLSDGVFEHANFYFAQADGADFRGAHLRESQWGFARLTGADFRDADLSKATFFQTDVEAGDLRGANLSGAFFERPSLKGIQWDDSTRAEGAIFQWCVNAPAGFLEWAEAGGAEVRRDAEQEAQALRMIAGGVQFITEAGAIAPKKQGE